MSKQDATARMAEASGLGPDEIQRIFREARANQGRLRSCPRHRFDEPVDAANLRQQPMCIECGGEMRRTDVLVYADGYAAAGGDRSDIWPQMWPGEDL